MNLKKRLEGADAVVCTNCRAEALSAFKSGGRVAVAVYPTSFTSAVKVLKILKNSGEPYCVIGMGSNLLISDKGYNGYAVCMRKLKGNILNGTSLYAYAGEGLMTLSQFASDNALSGLEFASGIPGSVGGAVFMNAGAYGGQIADVCGYADVYMDGEIHRLYNKDLDFAYRHSVLQDNGGVVLGVQFDLKRRPASQIEERMRGLKALRLEKQPREPSLGSVFKRVEGRPVPPLIEEAGLKGAKIGGAEVSTKHCGFIVNKGNATSQDYLDLVDLVKQKVFKKTGVVLEREIVFLGADTSEDDI